MSWLLRLRREESSQITNDWLLQLQRWLDYTMRCLPRQAMPTRLATFHLRRKINFLAFSSCQVLKLSQVVMIEGFFVSWVMSLAKRGNLGENVTDQWKFSYRGTRSNSFWVVFFLISQKLFYRKRSEVMHIFIEIPSQLITIKSPN